MQDYRAFAVQHRGSLVVTPVHTAPGRQWFGHLPKGGNPPFKGFQSLFLTQVKQRTVFGNRLVESVFPGVTTRFVPSEMPDFVTNAPVDFGNRLALDLK